MTPAPIPCCIKSSLSKLQHQHLLVIRFSALGDVAMTVPVIWALARQYPELRITVLSRPSSRPFFEHLSPNVNFMGADIKHEYHGMKGLNALYRRLTAKQFTAVADLHNVLRSNYLRIRFHMGHYPVAHLDKHRNLRRQLTASQPKKVLQPIPTAFQNYIDVFTRLGFPIAPENLCFRTVFENPEQSKQSAAEPLPTGDLSLLSEAIGQKRSGEQWIGIAPFATYEGKIYPQHLMEQVIVQLVARYPQARLFFFGRGEKEETVFKSWTDRWPQSLFVGDHTEGLAQELIIMSHLNVMLSMDSSNMHMASLTATPVVSVWGATHPYAGFMGWGQSEDNTLQASDLDCRPCSIYGKTPCARGDYACLNSISPQSIVQKVGEIVESGERRENSSLSY